MWRVLLYLLLFGIAATAAIRLADYPETVSLTWAGRQYSMSLAVGVVGVVALAMLMSLLWGAVRFASRLPGSVGRRSREKRRERSLKALSRGIVAVGAGDLTAARRYASEAERFVGAEPLALLLKAQAAQAAGDRPAAEAAFRKMADTPETRVLGLRGLFIEARRRGDADAARTCAEEVARIAPAIGWANEAVLEGHSAAGDWPAATRMVERRTSLGLLDRATSHRQRAVLRTAEALALEDGGPADAALAAALEAVRLAPDLVPAAALAGRLLSRKGDLRKAARVVEAAWRQNPHPDLAATYLGLRPGDSATDRLRRAETLARLSSWSPESRFAIAKAARDAREPDRARSVLGPLLEGRPTVRVCLLMAELEGLEGRSGRVREWLGRASRAPRDAAWVADGIVSDTWAPVSPTTGRLDAFTWEAPPEMLGGPEPETMWPTSGDDEPEPPRALPEPSQAVPVDIAVPPISEPAGRERQPDVSAEASSVLPVEPVAPAAPAGSVPAEVSGPAAVPTRPEPSRLEPGPRPTRVLAGSRDPEPVVFPVRQPPDDPGPDGSEQDAQASFRRGTR